MKRKKKSKEKRFVDRMQGDSKYFIEELLGENSLENYHKKICKAVDEFSRILIAACHSVGKTWIMARIALWFLISHKNSLVITTAPTGRQVKELLWGEMHSAYQKAPYELGGKLTTTKLDLGPKWYALGFSPQKQAGTGKQQEGSSFQGFHSDHIMVIFDEATGISSDIYKMVEGLLTSGKKVKWVQIANPTSRNCSFFRLFKSPEYKKIYLSCFDSPNLKANGITSKRKLQKELDRLSEMSEEKRLKTIENYKKPVPYLLSCQWVVAKALDWGMDHPLMLSKAFGEFPLDEDSVLIQLKDVEEAIAKKMKLNKDAIRYIGIDVARKGKDSTVITELMGNKQTNVIERKKRDLVYLAGEIKEFIVDSEFYNSPTVVTIDSTGMGYGILDSLVSMQKEGLISRHIVFVEAHFGGTCETDEEKQHYANLKALMFDKLAKDIKDKLSLMDVSAYLQELSSIEYTYTTNGKIQIESKKDYVKRTGLKSPDFADSLALANYGKYTKLKLGTFRNTKEKVSKKKEKRNTAINRLKKKFGKTKY